MTLKALSDPNHNNYCPIKLILALALRVGNVAGASIEDVLIKARQRRDKLILWLRADQPLIPAVHRHGTLLTLDTPAGTSTLARILAKAGQKSGILGHIASHDLRRGSAFDGARAKERPTGYADPELARSLGHSRQAFRAGVTDQYVGPSYYDHWTTRVESPPDTPRFGLELAATPYQKPPKLSAAQVSGMCIQKGFDTSTKSGRSKAARVYHQERFAEWVKSGPGLESTSGKPYHSALLPSRKLAAPCAC